MTLWLGGAAHLRALTFFVDSIGKGDGVTKSFFDTVTCVRCDATVAQPDSYFTGEGLVCAECFREVV